jgi:hypothetical protein
MSCAEADVAAQSRDNMIMYLLVIATAKITIFIIFVR